VDKCDFKKALSEAQRLGFAERNAALDVNGTDSAHKLALLALLAFGKNVTLKDIYVEGISGIQQCDIEYAKEMGYCIKLLAITKRSKDGIELRVHPTLLKEDHPLSAVRSVYNAIFVKGDCAGECLFYGKGAGRYPTASAVVADIVDLAKSINQKICGCGCNIYFDSGVKTIRPVQNIRSRYYVRFQALDKPGVLASISCVLSDYGLSISSVKQVERRSDKVVPIVMLTHEASEKGMAAALKKIDALSCIKHKSVAIRIESL
ncbi:MAG: homoserine dehydrogenase, partial [Candidatus Omnitrophota bacterium]